MIFAISENVNIDVPLQVGQEFYLIEAEHITEGWKVQTLSPRPGRTNMSREPLVTGWLGTTNDISRDAVGQWRISEVYPDRIVAERIDN